MFAFMAKSNNEHVNEKVTLSYFNTNVNVFSIRKLRKLVGVFINSISELTTEKDLFNNSLDIFQNEKIVIVTQIYDIEKQVLVLEAKNLELKEKIKRVTIIISKGKYEANILHINIENKFHTSEINMN